MQCLPFFTEKVIVDHKKLFSNFKHKKTYHDKSQKASRDVKKCFEQSPRISRGTKQSSWPKGLWTNLENSHVNMILIFTFTRQIKYSGISSLT